MAPDPYSALAGFNELAPKAQERLRNLGEILAGDEVPSSIDNPVEVAQRHIGDSLSGLAVEDLVSAGSIADIGSGAGLPGLVLAVVLEQAQLDLVESVARKAEFIAGVASRLELENVRAIPERAESWAADEQSPSYDAVTARALAPLAVLVEYAAPLLRTGGVLVAWKGALEVSERDQGIRAAAEVGMDLAQELEVRPFERSRDHRLCVFRKISETPERFPRRPGIAAKRPLGAS